MARVGKLRNRVLLQRLRKEKDSAGVAVDAVIYACHLWVNIKDLRANERVYGGVLQSGVDTEFTARKCNVKHGDIIEYGSDKYRVEGSPISFGTNGIKFYGTRTNRQ